MEDTDDGTKPEPGTPQGGRRGRALAPRRFLRSWGPWLIGIPLGLRIGTLALTAWIAAHPLAVVGFTREALEDRGWRIVVEDATFDIGEGWLAPSSWRWNVRGLAFIGSKPIQPTILLEDIVLVPPRPSWNVEGLVLTIPSATVKSFDLYFDEVARQKEPPPVGDNWITLVVKELRVETFDMTMRPGRNPEVIVEAKGVGLVGPFVIRPMQRDLVGELSLETAFTEIAGVPIREIRASRIAFTGLGLEVAALGQVGDGEVDAKLVVEPLIGPPEVRVEADLRGATLRGLADAIMGPGDMELIGRIDQLTAKLVAGGDLGPGNLEGSATLRVVEVGFTKPTSKRAVVVLAVTLAPFLHFDKAGNVVVGDFHGDVSFTQKGVSFDTLTYEAPHSVGDLRGYVRSDGISAKLHFKPREGSGAIEWGFVLRGEARKPKVALALPGVLRAWTPCADPQNCAIGGGASTYEAPAEPDPEAVAAALARETRKSDAQDRRAERKEDRLDARDARREAK